MERLHMNYVRDLIHRVRVGESDRRIARDLSVSRTTVRKYRQWADECLTADERKRLMARRRAKAEGSFADAANNHGFKRARWRVLPMVEIQNLMIAAIQNLRKLVKVRSPRKPSGIGVLAALESKIIFLVRNK